MRPPSSAPPIPPIFERFRSITTYKSDLQTTVLKDAAESLAGQSAQSDSDDVGDYAFQCAN